MSKKKMIKCLLRSNGGNLDTWSSPHYCSRPKGHPGKHACHQRLDGQKPGVMKNCQFRWSKRI